MSIEIVNKLKPVKYKYNDLIKNSSDKIHMGFIAQDLLTLFGEEYALVEECKDTKFLMVNYIELIAPLTKAVQELSKKVIELETQINLLNKPK